MDDRERRLDQEWTELLNELRVLLPGTEVLFAFLLTLPFSERFGQIARSDKTIYFIAFLASATASLLLSAPSAQHRLLWRQRAKDEQLRLATALALAGTLFVAVAVTSVVFLITNLLYDNALPAVVTAGVAGLIGWFWYGQPLWVRFANRGPPAPDHGPSSNAAVRREERS